VRTGSFTRSRPYGVRFPSEKPCVLPRGAFHFRRGPRINHDHCELSCMSPVVIEARPELRSKGLDRLQCRWHVRYQFCDLSAEITVYAENEAKARTKAINQLRLRGLKVG
jgi:hypothetical protein